MNLMSVGLVVKLSLLRWQRMFVIIVVWSAGCGSELDEGEGREKHEGDHRDECVRWYCLRLNCHLETRR